MITIDKTNISITRGDTAYIRFYIKDITGQQLNLALNDKVRCQVRDASVDGDLIFEGDVAEDYSNNTMVWHIKPNDTKELDFGTYYWDAQVEFANGDVFTFVNVSKFIVLPEITMIEE